MDIWTKISPEKGTVRLATGKEVELPQDGKYHHTAQVSDGKTIRLYVDGELVDEVNYLKE